MNGMFTSLPPASARTTRARLERQTTRASPTGCADLPDAVGSSGTNECKDELLIANIEALSYNRMIVGR